MELHDARLSKLDQQDAAAWDSPDAAEERRRRLSSPVHKQTGEIDPSVMGHSQQLHRALQAEKVESPQYATQYQVREAAACRWAWLIAEGTGADAL